MRASDKVALPASWVGLLDGGVCGGKMPTGSDVSTWSVGSALGASGTFSVPCALKGDSGSSHT